MSTEPEFKELIPIDLSGVTAEAVFGSPFVETPEQMIARRYVCSCHRRKSRSEERRVGKECRL